MWPEHRSDRESAYLRLWRLNNETVEAAAVVSWRRRRKAGGATEGRKQGRDVEEGAAWGRSGDGGTIGGESERGKRVRMLWDPERGDCRWL
ncbi:hypothetical protein OIU76_016562 [Salix suchowensis]|nr:hypothetical protein OIU76_016562 [Salix suchowensis]